MNQERSLKMKTMPMGKLIFSMSIPAMFSMLIQALYNVVDSIFVSQLDVNNNDLLTAISYAFPMQILIMAFSIGIGIGTNVLVARKLGERNQEEASNYAKTGLLMAIIMGVTFFLLSFIIVEPFYKLMSNSESIRSYGASYLRIVMMFSFGMFIEIIFNKILQGMGRMIVPMITQLIGAITNIILDPILIFGLLGFPALGIKGAAIATIIGQFAAMIFVVSYVFTHKFEIHLSIKNFKMKSKYVLDIIKVGLPATVMNAIGSLVNIFLNKVLIKLDDTETANAVLGTYIKLQSFVFMPVFGLNQGGMPILSYNYGANQKKRYNHAMKILISSAFVIMIIGFTIFQFFTKDLLYLFTDEDLFINIGVNALRIISIAFIPASVSIIITMAFQSLGYGFTALIMSILRQAVFLLPSAILLANLGGLKVVWFAFPIAELAVAIIFVPIIILLIKRAFAKKAIISNM